MTSSTSPAANKQPSFWNTMVPYITTPVGVSAGIFPVFYGFVVKSAQQTGSKVPPFVLKESLMGARNAAPLLATQVFVQDMIERGFKKQMGVPPKDNLPFNASLTSAITAVVVTAPALAVFNGWTMNHSWRQSIQTLVASPKLTGALIVRDTGFLLGFKVSKPMTQAMKNQFGDTAVVEYASVFSTGVVAALMGHPADTYFTCGQKKVPILSYWKGAPVRAGSVGTLLVFCRIIEQQMNRGANK